MKRLKLLLVEDNDGDVLLTSEVLEAANIIETLSVVKDGREAMDYLSKQGKHLTATTPDLVLLDINLPKRNGIEVLQYIRADQKLNSLPVIMLTTSSDPKEIYLCRQNNATAFFTKPLEQESLLEQLRAIEDSSDNWLSGQRKS
jgi:CheY-like chemotaxis protein